MLLLSLATASLAIRVGGAGAATARYRFDHGVALNDLSVTPGTRLAVGVGSICRPGYARSVRDVTEREKRFVYREYGIATHAPGAYEVDHLISLELGGSNAITNLWPEPNDHPHGYLNSKDILEDRLHELVCRGSVPLAAAQRAIAADWVRAFHVTFGRWPSPAATPSNAPSSGSPASGGSVTITALGASVPAGGTERLVAHSSRLTDACRLTVTLPSGRTSTARGIGGARSNALGDVRWSWWIAPDTDPGVAVAVVTCTAGSSVRRFRITRAP